MLCPNEIKTALRAKYFQHELLSPAGSFAEAKDRSFKFWSEYEQINRNFCPEDPVYSISNPGTALSTTADNLTVSAASAGQGRILEVILGGESTVSTVNRVALQRSAQALSGSVSITPEKFNSRSPASAGVYGKNNSGSLSGNPTLALSFNSFGGFLRWVAAPGEELYYVNSEVISLRSASGVGVISSTLIFEEL